MHLGATSLSPIQCAHNWCFGAQDIILYLTDKRTNNRMVKRAELFFVCLLLNAFWATGESVALNKYTQTEEGDKERCDGHGCGSEGER